MASGTYHLSFRCTSCGNCCRDLRVPLTRADLRRLVDATGQPAETFVAWLPTDAVDLTGEPGSLVLLDHEERRVLMTLAHRDGACASLGADERCSVYAARPASCRLYPFAPSFGRRGGLRRLRLLSGTRCDYARDGHNDAHALREADRERWAEHHSYLACVQIWNRSQRHRARLGHRRRSAREFLAFLGFVGGNEARLATPQANRGRSAGAAAGVEAPGFVALPTAALELAADGGPDVVNRAMVGEAGAPEMHAGAIGAGLHGLITEMPGHDLQRELGAASTPKAN